MIDAETLNPSTAAGEPAAHSNRPSPVHSKRISKMKRLIIPALIALALSTTAHAATVVSDTFSTQGDLSGDALEVDNSTGSPSTWEVTVTQTGAFTADSSGFANLTNSDTAFGDQLHAHANNLGGLTLGTVSFDLRWVSEPNSQSVILRLATDSFGTTNETIVHQYGASRSDLGVALNEWVDFDLIFNQSGSSQSYGSETINNDEMDVWVNGSRVATVVNFNDDGPINDIGWSMFDASAGLSVQIDNFVVEDIIVNPIPAPAALPAGLAMLGLITMRRRRA